MALLSFIFRYVIKEKKQHNYTHSSSGDITAFSGSEHIWLWTVYALKFCLEMWIELQCLGFI